MKDIVIIGSKGFAREILWLLEDNNLVKNEWNILGFIDDFSILEDVDGYPILGNDDWLFNSGHGFYVACGIGNAILRKKVLTRYKILGHKLKFPSIISHRASLSPKVVMGEGCLICSGSIITTEILLGDFVTINLACTVGHNSILGNFVTLNPGTNISGNVIIGEGTEVGTGVQIIQGKHIGSNVIIGAGSVIIRDIPNNSKVVGNPGRILDK